MAFMLIEIRVVRAWNSLAVHDDSSCLFGGGGEREREERWNKGFYFAFELN